ncbi:hypothetical protein J437_LFUL011996 [Ladona fulva]|uniref:HTH psq-type domain-containing protein n=1 Tax=Ladona fulva TaxID=123851 RepID=A0A8K0KJA6_LADFU|nr:hypothetical protein J437_LFUL011996 [Ladona fulva]
MASRKHKTLTLEDKVKIIKLINSGHSYDAISKTFGIGKSTVGDIKKNKDSIMKFVSTTESGSKKRALTSSSQWIEHSIDQQAKSKKLGHGFGERFSRSSGKDKLELEEPASKKSRRNE